MGEQGGTTGVVDGPDGLTVEWLTAVLTASGVLDGVEVSSVEHRPLGTGQVADSVRLRLGYSGPTDAPATLVAKLPAADPTSRATAVALGNYVKEVSFYRELADGLAIRTPTVHHVDIDDSGGCFVLLMEDLAPAVQGDQLTGCGVEVAAAALDQLVGLHAPRWDDPTLTGHAWLHTDPAARRDALLQLLPPLWGAFRDRYAPHLTDLVLSVGGALFDDRLDVYLAPTEGPVTVVHGDYRLDNLLLGPATTEVTAVDWQTVATGNAAADVAYFLGAGLLPGERRVNEDALVDRYHRALVDAGVEGYDRERCGFDYRRGSFSGLVMAVAASGLVERTERGDQMFLAMAGRHAVQADDLDALATLDG